MLSAGGRTSRGSHPPSPGQAADVRYPVLMNLGVHTPSSTCSMPRDQDTASQRGSATGKSSVVEKELEVERMWWSEASERQVTQLESTFNAEFEKTCKSLRSDILASKDKLEVLVQEEAQKRQSDVAELRQLIEGQNAMLIAEVAQRKGGGDASGGPTAGMQIHLQELRSELFAVKDDLRGTKDEWHKVQSVSLQLDSLLKSLTELWPRLGAIEAELQQQASVSRNFAGLESKIALASSLEEDVKSTRSSIAALAARADQSEEVLQKCVADAASLTSHIQAQEQEPGAQESRWQALLQEERSKTDAMVSELKAMVQNQGTLLMGEVTRHGDDLQDKWEAALKSEIASRDSAVSELRQSLEGQKTILSEVSRIQALPPPTVDISAANKSGSTDEASRAALLDIQDVRSQVTLLKDDLQRNKADWDKAILVATRLDGVVNGLEKDANWQATLLANMVDLRPRLEALEESVQQRQGSQPELSAQLEAQLRKVEEEIQTAKQAGNGELRPQNESAVVTQSVVTATPGEEKPEALGRLVALLQDLHGQLLACKEEAQGAKAESVQSVAASSRLETQVQTLETDANRQAKVLEGLTLLHPRVEALEEKIQQQSESPLPLPPQQSQATRMVSNEEPKTAKEVITSVEARTELCEQAVRRVASDSASLADRVKLIEAEISSLNRDGVPLMKEVKTLLQDFLKAAMLEAKGRDSVSSTASTTGSSVERRISTVSSRTLPKTGVESEGSEEPQLTAELKDLKTLLQPIQAAAAEFRILPQRNASARVGSPPASPGPTPQHTLGPPPQHTLGPPPQHTLGPMGTSSSADQDPDLRQPSSVFGDLKESIETLVHRVNDTLMGNTAASIPSSSASNASWRPQEPPAASQAQQEQFLKALEAVTDLRARNIDLRERNAELAAMLQQDGVPPPPSAGSIITATTERPSYTAENRSPNASPRRVGGLVTSEGTAPHAGVAPRPATIGNPGPRAPPSGCLGNRTLSSQPTPQLRSPGGRLGAGPNYTPQLRTSAVPATAQPMGTGSKIGTAPSYTGAPCVVRQPSRALPTTSRPGPISR